jgi:N-glycosylase/DNA lyase
LQVWEQSFVFKNRALDEGCQIFLGTTLQHGKNIPNNHKIPIPNCRKIDQMVTKYTLQEPPKFAQIGTFGLKMCHLATLLWILRRCHYVGSKDPLRSEGVAPGSAAGPASA